MAISDWPEGERPRERLLDQGANALSDAELLAIFLRTGVKGKSAVDLARELLMDFGGLRQLLCADLETFCQAKGLGIAKFTQLQACLEMSRRFLAETLEREGPLTNPDDAKQFLHMRMRDYKQEVFACLFLDTKNRVIKFEELFTGTLNSAEVHPREVVKQALKHNANAVILAHNHPSGDSKPSQSDIEITQILREALLLVDTKVLDHLIIGNEVNSLAALGYL
ncbi:MAG: DNA repair protein RadC [Gammaproteobacteria bacterium]